MNNVKEFKIDGGELSELLNKNDLSVPEFAVLKAKLTPQTIYKAINGKRLKPKSYRSISRAMIRLRGIGSTPVAG